MNSLQDVIELLEDAAKDANNSDFARDDWTWFNADKIDAAIAYLSSLPARTEAHFDTPKPTGEPMTMQSVLDFVKSAPDPVAERYRAFVQHHRLLAGVTRLGIGTNDHCIWQLSDSRSAEEHVTDIRRIVRNPDGSIEFRKE